MIGGNVDADVLVRTTVKNEIGEDVPTWGKAITLHGFLDLQSGDSKYNTYDAKIQESTHIFICDYVAMPACVTAENARMTINDLNYDIMLIDDPMGLHKHYEIYLKFIGGQ